MANRCRDVKGSWILQQKNQRVIDMGSREKSPKRHHSPKRDDSSSGNEKSRLELRKKED